MPDAAWKHRETRLRRVRDRIHLASCRYANGPKSLPWLWAEGLPDDVIRREAVEENGLVACRVCDPLGGDGGQSPSTSQEASEG